MAPSVSTGAILFTDMVDSTALRSRLGDDRADLLRKHHDDLLASVIEAHRGTVTRWTGDGVKAAFSTASDAVGAATAIQRAVIDYGTGDGAVAAFEVRVGLAVGEVTIDEGGDRRGVAVIEAARLEALARPGQILATEAVRMLGHRRSNVAFEEVGERTLKGLDQPVLVYRVIDLEHGTAPPIPRLLVIDRRFPLVGRDQQVAAFRSSWDDARAGSGGLMLVRGQPGIGKTRFVSQCADIAHQSGAIVLAGVCGSDVDVPYEPVVMACRSAGGFDETLDLAMSTRAGSLGRLFPGSTSSRIDTQPELARLELFEAVAALVGRLSRVHPLLLVVEDLHWATAPTVLLLRHLIQERDAHRLLIMGTYRPADLGASHPLRELLADVRSSGRTTIADLEVLSEANVAEMVTSLAGSAPITRVADIAHTVHHESAGNPFFASELLHHLASTGQLEQALTGAADHRMTTPDSVHDVVAQRLSRLAPGTHEMLTLAAVIGPTFDVGLLATVVDRDADDVLDVLEEVARAGIVVEVGVDQFAFVHAIVRTSMLDELSASRRARAHRRIAEALEARGAEQFDELARHWQLAGMESKSTKHLARAARRDLVALAFESARERYRQVIDLLNSDPHADVVERANAWLGFGAAARALGDASFRQAIVRAGRLARTARNPELMAEAASMSTWLGTSLFFIAEMPDTELIELCEDAISMLADDDPMRARILATLASHLTFGSTREPREKLIAEANDLAGRHGDPPLAADVLHAEFVCLWEPATLERREQIARDLGRLARATGDTQTEFISGFFAAYCLLERGDLPGSRARLHELAPVLELTKNEFNVFHTHRLLLTIDIVRSESDAQQRVDELFRRFRSTTADAEGTWMIQTAVLAYQAGALGQMVDALQAMTTGPQSRMWEAGLGLGLLCAGDRAGAEAVLDRPEEIPRNYFWLPVLQARAEVAAELGRRDHCQQIFDEVREFRGLMSVTGGGSSCFGLVSRTMGVLALALEDVTGAIELLTEAVEQADRIEAVFEAVSSRRSLAGALAAAGRTDAAATLLDEALTVAERRGFAREAQLIQRAQADRSENARQG
ncbi:MAG: AAA family ATPase [Acidimicrobiales bacterium]|nr:AAA family ATPase [Acidimicrobiales bacterium]